MLKVTSCGHGVSFSLAYSSNRRSPRALAVIHCKRCARAGTVVRADHRLVTANYDIGTRSETYPSLNSRGRL